MLITKVSPLTGKSNTMDISVTGKQLQEWQKGTLIQEAMPNLTPDEREFIMTGSTTADWEDMYGGAEFESKEYKEEGD